MTNYYRAKFDREAKTNPTDWVIITDRSGRSRLKHLPRRVERLKKECELATNPR